MDSPKLVIEVPGKLVSGNHYKTLHLVKNGDARLFIARVRSIASAAALTARWNIPEYVRLDLVLHNQRLDVDNACKVLFDGLQGIAYHNDSRILVAQVVKRKDHFGPRATALITPLDPKALGY